MVKRALQPIGDRVLSNYGFLKKLCRCKSDKKRTMFLQNASCNELLSLTEISSNILRGKFNLTPGQKKKILPHAPYIRKLGALRSEKGARNFIKNQKGGQAVLGALLAPILIEAARHLISKVAGDGSE